MEEALKQCSDERLQQLQRECCQTSGAVASWLDPSVTDVGANERARFFHGAGFLHLPQFVSEDVCHAMKQSMRDIVESEWKIDSDNNDNDDSNKTVDGRPGQNKKTSIESFGTSEQENTARGDYFLDSADRVHFFAEPTALTGDHKKLKEEFLPHHKLGALNKVGHGLHLRRETPFAEYSYSAPLQQLVKDLGWNDPVLPQSMYIFKQPVVGGAVNSHQDSTFLFTTPRQTCCGLWLALDDATLENGCLWVRPKSHRESVRRQFRRNPMATEKEDAPKCVMTDLQSKVDVPWDGSLPGKGTWEDLLQAGFIPVPCRAGDLLAFNGELDHLSLPNHSSSPRHTFQLHLVEGESEGVKWSPDNWLQYPDNRRFPSLKLGIEQL